MTIGIAVIGAGMAGKAHAAAYRVAPTLYESTLPDLRYVSIGDMNAEVGRAVARRYGYERSDTDWRAIADDPDIQVVSVVIANSLHLEVVRGLIEAGKHVLCEKPLSDTLASARKMPTWPGRPPPSFASASPTAASPASRRSGTGSRTEPSAGCCTSRAATGVTTAATRWRR